MDTLLISMYLASAILPIVGIVRLFGGASRDAEAMEQAVPTSDGDGVSFGQVNVAMPILVRSIRSRPDNVRADLWLIGSGVGMGALAGILSLFI